MIIFRIFNNYTARHRLQTESFTVSHIKTEIYKTLSNGPDKVFHECNSRLYLSDAWSCYSNSGIVTLKKLKGGLKGIFVDIVA